MAYNPYEEDDEELKQLGGALAPGGQTGGGQRPAAPVSGVMPSNSNRFVNFASYFNANNGQAKGDGLVTQLDTGAIQAQQAAKDASAGIQKQAQAGTLQGPTAANAVPTTPPVATVAPQPYQPPSAPQAGVGRSRIGLTGEVQKPVSATQHATTQSGVGYAGPKEADVYGAFQPVMKQAGKAARDINTAQDVAGVAAVTSKNGFQSALASAGAGGRKGDLRRKYAGLVGGAEAARKTAWDAAQKGAADSAAAAEAWKTNAAEWTAYDDALKQANSDVVNSVQNQAAASRATGDARREKEKSNPDKLNANERTRTIDDEEYALRHGLTLEQWVAAGKPDLRKATADDLRRWRGGG